MTMTVNYGFIGSVMAVVAVLSDYCFYTSIKTISNYNGAGDSDAHGGAFQRSTDNAVTTYAKWIGSRYVKSI